LAEEVQELILRQDAPRRARFRPELGGLVAGSRARPASSCRMSCAAAVPGPPSLSRGHEARGRGGSGWRHRGFPTRPGVPMCRVRRHPSDGFVAGGQGVAVCGRREIGLRTACFGTRDDRLRERPRAPAVRQLPAVSRDVSRRPSAINQPPDDVTLSRRACPAGTKMAWNQLRCDHAPCQGPGSRRRRGPSAR